MAKKTLAAQMYAAHRKRKLERQKAAERMQREWEQELRRQEREDQARQRADERAAQQRQRAATREAREAEVLQKKRRAEAGLADADSRSGAVAARVTQFERLLLDRKRDLTSVPATIVSAFDSGGPTSLADATTSHVPHHDWPEGVWCGCQIAYAPESRELVVEYELPPKAAIPTARSYRYVKARDEIVPVPRKEAEIKTLYGDLLGRCALRLLAELFGMTPATLVDGIMLNAYASAKDKATGQTIKPYLISLNATRSQFAELVLEEPELDPVECLKYMKAIVSPHPYDLQAVRPVAQFDLSRYKFVDAMDVISGLDSRLDLLTLEPVEFEHLIQNLYEAIGLKAWVTQASRDDGVDAVAVNEDPVTGGQCVIQAKRYSRVVELSAIHALAGVMDDMNAAKGILVTTSYFGKASRDFAARNGRIQLIEGRELKHQLAEHLGLDVLISLPKVPPGWTQSDLESSPPSP